MMIISNKRTISQTCLVSHYYSSGILIYCSQNMHLLTFFCRGIRLISRFPFTYIQLRRIAMHKSKLHTKQKNTSTQTKNKKQLRTHNTAHNVWFS